jgi:hypothetical protein
MVDTLGQFVGPGRGVGAFTFPPIVTRRTPLPRTHDGAPHDLPRTANEQISESAAAGIGVDHDLAEGRAVQRVGRRGDFDSVWQRRGERLRKYPAAGSSGVYDGWCARWTLPAQPWRFGQGQSPLQLVGHLYEPVTPIGWALDMRRQIGGALLTVEDGHHGSLSSLPCASKAVEFFSTGNTSSDSCAGEPIPAP